VSVKLVCANAIAKSNGADTIQAESISTIFRHRGKYHNRSTLKRRLIEQKTYVVKQGKQWVWGQVKDDKIVNRRVNALPAGKEENCNPAICASIPKKEPRRHKIY
jgi:hypothetical protein